MLYLELAGAKLVLAKALAPSGIAFCNVHGDVNPKQSGRKG